MSIYDDLQLTTKEIMKEFKQGNIKLIQFAYPENSTPDYPGEPVETVIELDATAKGPSFKYLQLGFNTVSDKEVTSAVVDNVKPTVDDFIEIDGERFKILKFDSVPSAGVACAWKFIVRRGG